MAKQQSDDKPIEMRDHRAYAWHMAMAKDALQRAENLRRDEAGDYMHDLDLEDIRRDCIAIDSTLAQAHVVMAKELRERGFRLPQVV